MPKVTFKEDINGILCPERNTFTMIFRHVQKRQHEFSQVYEFYQDGVLSIDENGIEVKTPSKLVFKAQVYDFFYSKLSEVSRHIKFLYLGLPNKAATDKICERLNIQPHENVSVVFFTKDLTIDSKNPLL